MIHVIGCGVACEAEEVEASATRLAQLLHAERPVLQYGLAAKAKRRQQRVGRVVVLAYVPG